MVVEQINPNIIQIGNEINNGFLHPEGSRYAQPSQFLELLSGGIQARAIKKEDIFFFFLNSL